MSSREIVLAIFALVATNLVSDADVIEQLPPSKASKGMSE